MVHVKSVLNYALIHHHLIPLNLKKRLLPHHITNQLLKKTKKQKLLGDFFVHEGSSTSLVWNRVKA